MPADRSFSSSSCRSPACPAGLIGLQDVAFRRSAVQADGHAVEQFSIAALALAEFRLQLLAFGDVPDHGAAFHHPALFVTHGIDGEIDPAKRSVGPLHLQLFLNDLLTGPEALQRLQGQRLAVTVVGVQFQHALADQLLPGIPSHRLGLAVAAQYWPCGETEK